MRTEPHALWLSSLVAFLSIAIVFVLIVWKDLFVPIVIAIAIWYIINEIASHMRSICLGGRRLPGRLAFGLSICSVFVVCAVLLRLLIESGEAIAAAGPVFVERSDAMLNSLAEVIGGKDLPSTQDILGGIKTEALAGFFVGSITSLLFDAIMIFFYVVFLLVQQRYIPKKLGLLVADPDRRQRWRQIIARIQHDIQRYISVMVILAIVTGLFTFAVLRSVGVEYAALWSVIVAFLSFLPTIGTVFGIVVPTFVTMLHLGDAGAVVTVLLTLGAAQIMLNNLLQPAMMGKSLNLSPFIVLVALAVWSTIWGVTGAILSIPITVAATIILAHLPGTRPLAILMSLDGEIN